MKKRDLIAAAILAGIVTLVFSDVLFLGRAFYFRDVTRFYYPVMKAVRAIVLSGDFPSWNPYFSAGQPLAANPEYAVFYPGNWLLLLPDYFHAFQLHVVIHYWIAALGSYALLRWWRLRVESALFGAIAFTCSGLLLSLVNLLPCLFVLVWLPLIVLFVSRAMTTNRVRDAGVAGLFLGLAMLGGEPVTIAQVVLITVACALWPRISGPPLRRRAALVAAVCLTGFLIALVQIIPAADHVRDSVRSKPFPFELVSTWSTPPLRAAELLLPSLFGPVSDHARFFWGTAKYRWLDPFLLGIYFGLLPAALALAALGLRRGAWVATIIALAAGFFLAVGSSTPLLRLLYETRLFSSFRFPEKFLILALTPLIAFSAFAFDRLAGGDVRVARVAAAIAGGAAIVFFFLYVASRSNGYPEAFTRFWGLEVHPLRNAMAALSSRVWVTGLIRATIVLLLLLARFRMRAEVWSRVAIAVLVIDLGFERRQVAETTEGSLFTQTPAIASRPLGSRLFHQADWYNVTPIARSWLDLPEMYWVIRNGAFPLTTAQWGIETALNRDVDRTSLLPSAELIEAMLELRSRRGARWFEPLMAMSAAGYRAMYLPLQGALERAGGIPRNMQPIILVPEATNPRYYFADQIVPSAGRKDFVELLSKRTWSRRVAFTAANVSAAPARVLSVRERSNAADLTVDAAGQALLVCSITRHKYWRATIDGRPAALVPVNLAFQAVQVPPGRHEVRLSYRNPLLLWSGLVSLLALLATIAAIRSRSDIFRA